MTINLDMKWKKLAEKFNLKIDEEGIENLHNALKK